MKEDWEGVQGDYEIGAPDRVGVTDVVEDLDGDMDCQAEVDTEDEPEEWASPVEDEVQGVTLPWWEQDTVQSFDEALWVTPVRFQDTHQRQGCATKHAAENEAEAHGHARVSSGADQA